MAKEVVIPRAVAVAELLRAVAVLAAIVQALKAQVLEAVVEILTCTTPRCRLSSWVDMCRRSRTRLIRNTAINRVRVVSFRRLKDWLWLLRELQESHPYSSWSKSGRIGSHETTDIAGPEIIGEISSSSC